MLTLGSVCTGIGGLDLGLERSGMDIRWQCELDAFCRRVLAGHWPAIPCFRDIHELADPPTVDVLAGGVPCQPVSTAGKRTGPADDRWLWPEFFRLVDHLRPRYAILENVPGLLSLGMGEILGDLANIGYDAEWDCLPAGFFGAPHLRWRVFLVAYPTTPGRPLVLGHRRGTGTEALKGWPTASLSSPASALAWLEGSGLPEPPLLSPSDGVPAELEQQLGAYGNAVVPQVAEWVGRQIIRHAQEEAA